jgi:hypothetical protein
MFLTRDNDSVEGKEREATSVATCSCTQQQLLLREQLHTHETTQYQRHEKREETQDSTMILLQCTRINYHRRHNILYSAKYK